MNEQHVKQRWNAKPHHPVSNEECGSLPFKGAGHKVTRHQEQQAHEEGLQENLVCGEYCEEQGPGFWLLDKVPAAYVAVSDGSMHTHNQCDHYPTQVVDKQEPAFRRF